MKNFRISVAKEGQDFDTLTDILPKEGNKLKILFIAKTPAPISVKVGHYFQGRQGKMFWNMLNNFDILNSDGYDYEDECLLPHGYGITDIVKLPRAFGNEPSDKEYQDGLSRIIDLINLYQPEVCVFVYKKVLDNLLKLGFKINSKSGYGFNGLLEKYFHSQIFVFPMPGTPCTRQQALEAMSELKNIIHATAE